MSLTDIFSIPSSAFAPLGGGAVIVSGFSIWLGRVWSNRIQDAEKAKHDVEMETMKAEIAKLSQDRTRKLESIMRHYERQIEEFYGPLFNMVHQVFVANHIQWDILNAQDKDDRHKMSTDQIDNIQHYYQATYFRPLHDDIRSIIRTKLYLIEGSEMPLSFYKYLKHAAQERDQIALWENNKIDSSFLPGEPWPQDFYDDIKSGFENAMRNYEECLDGLKGS